MGADLTSKTIGGLLAYCDWLKEKHYLRANAVEAWKTAINKVFTAVEPDGYESMSLDDLDLEDVFARFRVAAGSKYRSETIDVYAQRIRRAMEAHQYYLEHNRPPSFRQQARGRDDAAQPERKARLKAVPQNPAVAGSETPESSEVFDFAMPLSNGRLLTIPDFPKRWLKADVDRLHAMVSALQVEEQRQLPRTTGESAAA